MRLFFVKIWIKGGLFVQKKTCLSLSKKKKELAKIKAIIPGSARRQFKVRLN